MTSSCRDTIAQLKAVKKNRTFNELKGILEANGFTMHRRNAGSHRAFTRPGVWTSPVLIEGADPLSAAYVRQVIRALEECCDD